MIALIDETTPDTAGGSCYVVVTAVVLRDEAAAKSILESVLPPGRIRPFHWHLEGRQAKQRMVAALHDIEVDGRAIAVPCGRSGQERARATALTATLERLLDDRCERVIIESRAADQDRRDQATILDTLTARGADLSYEWRGKSETLLWIPDAIGGAIREHLIGAQPEWYPQIEKATGLELAWM